MLGSAAQNVIALTDSVFLYHVSEEDFASIGFASVFYLIVAAIGFGFSRGGQIMIARRIGEGNPMEVGRTFYAMLYFELGLSVFMFFFMKYGCYYFFQLFVDSDIIFHKSLEYIEYRSWGVFFSYAGVAIIALYTGIARTWFILVDAIFLAAFNIMLDYALVYGHWGFPEMGIAGAGLASSISEMVAFGVFIVFIFMDKKSRGYALFRIPAIDMELIRTEFRLSTPMVMQAMVGLGSWFVFFSIVENLGERQLAITNLVRMVYLILSIPTWGFSTGVNTMVSNFIGQQKRQAVLPIIWKTAKISWMTTMVMTIPILLFPHEILYPLLGGQNVFLIDEARPVFYVLAGILTAFSIGGVYFNGLAGTGATFYGFKIQLACAIGYLIYIYIEVNYTNGGLVWAWAAEMFYWIAILLLSIWYIRSRQWHLLQV
ncbi:MAG: MATE family efflux transporter [Saprospiraceae bacterium]|nr:MATE family efflux transporter [Saprospiraceae bacterium]MCB9322813.1 MATE family efflux transporter [Lewinellaceae bacterium]